MQLGCGVRYAPNSYRILQRSELTLCADFVAEVGDWKTAPDRGEFLKAIYYARSMWRRALCLIGIDTHNAYAAQAPAAGGGRTISLASRRRFWAMAASVNSSCAPRGPRSRRRPSLRMRFKCANNISMRFLPLRDCSNASGLANTLATSRASS
jgi:hypothetical protein